MHVEKKANGIGFGFCGLVDARNTRISSTNGKYTDAVSLDLSQWAKEQFGLPLRLENDARLALLGECYAGAAQGEADVVMFTLGTGIGGVAMLDGHLLRGKHEQAGVLGGHTPVILNGRRCTCGGLGCAESEASGWSLPLVANAWPGFAGSAFASRKIDFENLFSCAASGDSVAREIVDHCLRVWGAAAVAAIHAFDPEVLIYGGGIMKSAGAILPFLQRYVQENAWTPWGTVRVRAAQLGNDAAILGVVPLFERELPLVR
jgi:glucokinase